MARPDIVIVGAGLAGTSLAWHLSFELDVLVVEQSEHACAEASAQNAGIVMRVVHDPDELALACRGLELLTDLPGDDWDEAPVFRRTGAVVGIVGSDGALDAPVGALAARGARVEPIEPERLARVAPAMAGSPVRRSWFLPDDGVCDPHALGAGFIRGARRRGARFSFGERVVDVLRQGDAVVGVRTDRGAIHAGRVVLATAAWSRALARDIGLDRQLRPLARHLFFAPEHPLATGEHPWCWLDDAGVYVRPETGGFLGSPCDENERDPDPGPGSRRAPEAIGRALLHDKIERYLPALRDARFSTGWIGLRTFAAGRRPMVGPDPELRGLFWLTGLGGMGVTCAFPLGERAALELLGR